MTVMEILLNTRINDLDRFMDEIRHWDLDFRLMTCGGIAGRIIQMASQDVLVTYARIQRCLHQEGATPPGYRTFVIPGSHCNGFWWLGQQVTRDDLLVFPTSNELDSVSHEDFEVYTISLRIAYFEQLVDYLGLRPLDGSCKVIRLSSSTIDSLRYLAGKIVRSQGGSNLPSTLQSLVDKLIICVAEQTEDTTHSRKRGQAVTRVVDYVRNTHELTADLAQLCRIGCVSERTLQYAFKERYGIAPNVFVKRWKLNMARRLLLQTDPEQTTITKVAMSLGFLHQGQFAADYRRLFLELPSETLGRSE